MTWKEYNLKQAQEMTPGQEKDWLYNVLDVTGTREVADALLPRLAGTAQELTYKFERAQQAPAFDMMMRGLPVNVPIRKEMVRKLGLEIKAEERKLSKMPGVVDVWDGEELETGFCDMNFGKRHKWPRAKKGEPAIPEHDKTCGMCGVSRVKKKPFSPSSPTQVAHLLYDIHNATKQYNKEGGVTTNDEALDKIGHKHPELFPITDALRNLRDLNKQHGTLSGRLSSDQRYHSSFNVGAAWTGRFSSSKSPFQEGGNLQNVTERHRHVFQPDPGYDICYIDLKQAESNVVAHVSQDEGYIEAHAIGDVHTYVTRLVWPDMPWTGDIFKDKKIAKQLPEWDPVEGHDFRFQSKRIQHGSNFGLTPFGIALIAHIPTKAAKAAQINYFAAFPGIPAWQASIRGAVMEHRPLVNLLGRKIVLMGRPWDEHTVKQGLAFIPQSTVADILDLAMLRIWNEMDPTVLQLFAQVHDALLLQFPRGRMDVIEALVSYMRIPILVHGRRMVIQPEVAIGQNWGHASDANPNGLKEIDI